ncbi:hypothetical protein CR513_37764, partial [Mucuna pruriens]
MIIDNKSCANVASTLLVEKLNLPTKNHPNPYRIKKVTHDGYKNRHTLAINKRIIILTPLKPIEAYYDEIRIARKCKLREEQVSNQEKERKENMSENKNEKHKMDCNEEKTRAVKAIAIAQLILHAISFHQSYDLRLLHSRLVGIVTCL